MNRATTVLPLVAAIASALAAWPAAAQSRDTTDTPRVEMTERATARPVIGLVLAQDAQEGVAIAAVTPGSAAAEAGLRTGDRLVAIDGHPLLGTTGALRVLNARKLLAGLDVDRPVALRYVRDGDGRDVRVTPRMSDRVVVWVGERSREVGTDGDAVVMDRRTVRRLRDGGGVPGVAPDIRREVVRLDDAGTLLEAFRWNGLNLATVGTELGRYFGTDKGVLVLSAGADLDTLQPGDVIRKVGKTPVASPREAMAALRALAPGTAVTLDVLRDRKPTLSLIHI